jgi:hypothetical protein
MNDQIMKEFGKKALKNWGENLFYEQDAILLIQKCRELNIKILGVETFILNPPYTQPMDYFDYTGDYDDFEPKEYEKKYHIKKYTDSGRWADAIQFVKDHAGQGWLFEIEYEGS